MNRRDLLKLAGGSALGLAFTPVPWKLLDDSAIWTQNWSWTPKVPRGEVTTRYSTCTLCPAACGVQARCVAGVPFSLAGVAGHPSGCGALCAAGVAGHYLAYGAARVRRVLHRGQPAGLEQALAAVRNTKGAVAVLDEHPGRAMSDAWRNFAASLRGGMYFVPAQETGTFETLRRLVDKAPPALGIDLERTKTLLSFGAPVLDGWTAPGRAWAARADFRLIQAEPRQSNTASAADVWLPIKPGTEAALGLGIAHVILRDGLAAGNADYRAAVERFTPEAAAAATGLSAAQIVETAREFASRAPSVAVSGGGPLSDEAELAVAGLNLLCGSVGRRGGIVARRDLQPPAPPIVTAADGSIGALIIDAAPAAHSMPWPVIRRKLAPGAVVVALSPFPHPHADYVVPAPVYLESLQDVPSPPDAPRATFSLSLPLLPAASAAVDPAAFLAALAAKFGVPSPAAAEDLIKQRAAAIHALGRGSLFSYGTGETNPLPATAEEFWTALSDGACWVDEEPPEAPPGSFRLAVAPPAQPGPGEALVLVPSISHGSSPSPMATKLTQESGLRPAAHEIAVHPDTAAGAGLEEGCRAVVETSCGSAAGRVRIASSVRPGVLESGLLDICGGPDCTWRAMPAGIRRAG
jgi:anaerobic selenocysteine-containing dehydrogenase